MKKKLLIILIIVAGIIIIIVGKGYFEKMNADEKIIKFITEKAGIPSSEILVIKPIEKWSTIGDSEKEYSKHFTTKKDFETWKEKLKEKGKDSKNVKAKDCEIQYYCTYSPKISKFKQTDVYHLQYSLFGNSVNSLKEIESNFAYPPNEYIKNYLKE